MPPSVRNIRPPSCGRRFRYFVIALASVLVALLLLNGNRPYCFGVSVTQLPQRARVVAHGPSLDDLAVNEAEHPNRRRSNCLSVGRQPRDLPLGIRRSAAAVDCSNSVNVVASVAYCRLDLASRKAHVGERAIIEPIELAHSSAKKPLSD